MLLFSLASRGQQGHRSQKIIESKLLASLKAGKTFDAGGSKISSAFIERLVLHPPNSTEFKRNGISIRHAVFEKDLDLSSTASPFPLDIQESHFQGKVNMNDIKINSYTNLMDDVFDDSVDLTFANFTEGLYLDNSTFKSMLDLSHCNDKEDLSFQGATLQHNCSLTGARIANDLQFDNSIFEDSDVVVDANNCSIGGSLVLSGGTFYPSLVFTGSTIGRFVNMAHSHFKRALVCIVITGSQVFSDSSNFQSLSLSNATVTGLVLITHSTFAADLTLSSLLAGNAVVQVTDDGVGSAHIDNIEARMIDLSNSRFGGCS